MTKSAITVVDGKEVPLPGWLTDADTKNAVVSLHQGCQHIYQGMQTVQVTWHGGIWFQGVWKGDKWENGTWESGRWLYGDWCGGIWVDGIWENGVWLHGQWKAGAWCNGVWFDGVWEGGTWEGGTWLDGTWERGNWEGGIWRRGKWLDTQNDRLQHQASLAGVTWYMDGGQLWGMCNRYTGPGGQGLWDKDFREQEGYFESDTTKLDPGGAEHVCVAGKHGCSAGRARHYHGPNTGKELWVMRFRAKDLAATDGEKVRVLRGYIEKVDCPGLKL